MVRPSVTRATPTPREPHLVSRRTRHLFFILPIPLPPLVMFRHFPYHLESRSPVYSLTFRNNNSLLFSSLPLYLHLPFRHTYLHLSLHPSLQLPYTFALLFLLLLFFHFPSHLPLLSLHLHLPLFLPLLLPSSHPQPTPTPTPPPSSPSPPPSPPTPRTFNLFLLVSLDLSLSSSLSLPLLSYLPSLPSLCLHLYLSIYLPLISFSFYLYRLPPPHLPHFAFRLHLSPHPPPPFLPSERLGDLAGSHQVKARAQPACSLMTAVLPTTSDLSRCPSTRPPHFLLALLSQPPILPVPLLTMHRSESISHHAPATPHLICHALVSRKDLQSAHSSKASWSWNRHKADSFSLGIYTTNPRHLITALPPIPPPPPPPVSMQYPTPLQPMHYSLFSGHEKKSCLTKPHKNRPAPGLAKRSGATTCRCWGFAHVPPPTSRLPRHHAKTYARAII
ncbi:hypothetical protein C7M84_015670 [Penaeus vannamei]|uniref:Uncharacterized protein n=1 Tax=Penaeus vannamei TaxID=6689 RepID=A0A3R7Q1U3_PENVA|nr:hypothetical protein C7M84_015670 [Penaeus vannamei]